MAHTSCGVFFLALISILYTQTEAVPLNPTESDFTHDAVLDNYNKYKLFWKFDSEKIVFEVHVQTTGYVGFGFSPNGGMPGSDIVIGWVKSNGQERFTDRHALHYGEPRVDDKQDYTLLYGAEINDHTILKFERKLDTCDDAQDWMITGDTVRLIWAYHPEDPVDGQPLPWHGRETRGVRSLYLLDEPKVIELEDDVKMFEMLNSNVKVHSHKDTTYMCLGFKLPEFNGTHHMVKYDPIIQPGNEANVHHFVVYQCHGDFNETAYHNYSYECYTPNMPEDLHECDTMIIAWAVGGGPFYFPENAGFSLGGPDDPTFLLFETHYDNAEYSDTLYDSSGLRIYYTPTLRESDATLLSLGGITSPLGTFAPPQAESFKYVAYCSSGCTEHALTDPQTNETTDLHVFALALHTHLAGRAVRVRHVRDGVELPQIGADNHYDFNYQEFRSFREEVIIKAGDSFIVECEYGTMDRQTPVWGGLGTRNEMCLAFLYVYPRTTLLSCLTMLLPDSMGQALGVPLTYANSYTPLVAGEGISFFDYLNHKNWTDESRSSLEMAHQQGMVYEYCSAYDEDDEREGPSPVYFPEPVANPLPDNNRQCPPEDDGNNNGGGGNGNVGNGDEVQSNGCGPLGQCWIGTLLCVLIIFVTLN